MNNSRPIWLLLAPALAVVLILFMGGLLLALVQSFGLSPVIGESHFSFDAYTNVLSSRSFAASLWLTVSVSLISTLLSTAFALVAALALRGTFRGKRVITLLFQLNLPIPHIVGAVALAQLFSQSGLLARGVASLGLIHDPAQFPVLVYDRAGLGIMLEIIWKEVPFIGITLLAALHAIGEEYEQVAQMLGASRWQRFRRVLLPMLMPAIVSTSVIAFAFVFGSFEVPLLLGVRFPQMLPVLAYRSYSDVDLNARPEAMAISVIITLIVAALVLVYMRVTRPSNNNYAHAKAQWREADR